MKKAMRFNQGKLPLDLVDPFAIEGLASVLQFGAQKYEPHNWRKGLSWSETIASLKRHLSAIEKGELIDPESNLPHIDHIGCNWMFLSNMMKFPQKYSGFNDLYQHQEVLNGDKN